MASELLLALEKCRRKELQLKLALTSQNNKMIEKRSIDFILYQRL